MTKLSNGLVVASVENNSPVFRVAAVVQAGAKYEPYESRGVTTMLRVFSNLVRRPFHFDVYPFDCLEHQIYQSHWSDEKFRTSRRELQVNREVH